MKKEATKGMIIPPMLLILFLVAANADDFNSELLNAAAEGDIARVTKALEKGANIEAKNEAGATPLMWAALKGHLDVVKLLTNRGANVNTKTSSGATALKGAATQGHLDIVRFLLEKGADANAKDKEGKTILDAARDSGQNGAVKILQAAMPKPSLPERSGQQQIVQDKFGAIAYSPLDGSSGTSNNYGTQAEAEVRALQECTARGKGCKIFIGFKNSCGALAIATNGASGWAHADTKDAAIERALGFCRQAGGKGCKSRCWACNDH